MDEIEKATTFVLIKRYGAHDLWVYQTFYILIYHKTLQNLSTFFHWQFPNNFVK